MKNILLCLGFVGIFMSCGSNNSTTPSYYFTQNEQDSLLANIITYIYVKAPEAHNDTRFQARFRSFYVKNLAKFQLENYYQSTDSTAYYFVIRPVGNSPKYKRGVVGKFKFKDKTLMPTEFEEVINTPPLEEQALKERGGFLFKELIKNNNLDKYLTLKHYIEWPDSTLVYDKKMNEWVNSRAY
jgi:hypothetical protein